MGPIIPKAKPMPERRGGASSAYVCTVIPPPGNPGTETGPRQPPTPPPSGVVEPPEPSSDQAKVKFWRDRALQVEARLVEHDRQLQQQGQEILDLSWRAKVAADWTQWWEHHRHEFPTQSRPSTRTVRQPPSPSTERRSRSRSASTSVTRQTGRSVTPRRDTRRSATPTRRGRAGRGPLNDLEEETLQEVEEFDEHLLESFENFPEPLSQATMVCVNGYDRDDLEPHKPWASRLDHTELVEMARRQRREVIQAKTGGWAPYCQKPGITRLPCCTISDGGSTRARRGVCHHSSMMVRSTSGERPSWPSQAIEFTSCSATIQCRRQSLDCLATRMLKWW